MKLTMLGTGNALVTNCYNTCFVLQDANRYFMVDAGGGNGILSQLKKAGIDWKEVKDIFITHKHIDHLLGAIWMIRMICQHIKKGEYNGEANIYGHAEVIQTLRTMAEMVLQKTDVSHLNERLHLITVEDGEEKEIIGHQVKFFDIHSKKDKQFGFTMELSKDKKLTCCGDEPYNISEKEYVKGSNWLLHEAFCLHSQAEIFHPYEKHHSTVKDACQLAQEFDVENLVLYHTEDRNLNQRKEQYTAEGKQYFHGNLYIPDDLETILL